MKKVLFLGCFICSIAASKAQGFKAGFGVGYLTEIDGGGGSVDLIYELDEKWGIGNTNTFSVATLDSDDRLKWFAVDLNARYKVYEEFYVFAGGEYLSQTLNVKSSVGGFVINSDPVSESFFGGNLGGGYKLHIVSNVNAFGEVKYTIIDAGTTGGSGYVHARLGLVFDF
ncbi:MAG: hypothetical protein ACSHW7_07325 [Patiriisocius sp.]|uniref:hypothetical protein n=1 Tax=Patiriisocius sp. TaxID=2822396 RepID=UPI003EF2162D